MTHVIGEPCIGVKDASCAAICPVACIHDAGDRYAIDPDRCIDCGACIAVCPVSAIMPIALRPTEWREMPG
ncbi:indolepyruvate ferredoxin oxidoreductase subunit alpha [Jannaschia donghaensis]|uniref:Ferredoxin n=1 Tax=Jannaschia donghaensis TaxID=420998 RepID=A0A0M6YJH6_9RHOB|nr:4Fe-4S binding protein [Jannaschia donghaensis]CTQ50511.1 Seven-iron ferredoxin [Jannaschia donghaensis]